MDSRANFQKLREGYSIPLDPANTGPLASIINRPSDDTCKVLRRGEDDTGVLMSFNNQGAAVLKVKDSLQQGDMLGRLVQEGQVIEEEARLE